MIRLRGPRLEALIYRRRCMVYSVEWVCNNSGNRNGNLSDHELGGQNDSGEVRTARVENLEVISMTELCIKAHDNADGRGSDVVEIGRASV